MNSVVRKCGNPEIQNDKPTKHNSRGSESFKSKLLSAGSCHYVTEMDLFCMRMVWTPKSHAMHHIRRGWRVRKAQKVCLVLM